MTERPMPVPRDPRASHEAGDTDLGPELEAALAAVEDLGQAPLAEHVSAFDAVHRLLQTRLAEADR
ncbi:hypothetical protein GCG21_07325 [Pseudactinotalea sp. HY160]|uniref:hypothetical protein n=1 Tax=Pseudactinotalea sp. HY160 TaxID=2654490 RepID=UPI00128DD9F0|nr:hypothetical protein [Pseudactinotalea sp. HY160]MPV49814.1 hypothetical protein [Pseudactinotalea sp. HY160]